MNIELLLKIRKQIEKEPQLFDISAYRMEKSCGTAHCFGGWALVLSGVRISNDRAGWFRESETSAKRVLDLTHDQAMELFYPWHSVEDTDIHTKEGAIAFLDAFIIKHNPNFVPPSAQTGLPPEPPVN